MSPSQGSEGVAAHGNSCDGNAPAEWVETRRWRISSASARGMRHLQHSAGAGGEAVLMNPNTPLGIRELRRSGPLATFGSDRSTPFW